MTKHPTPIARVAITELDAIKEMHPQSPSQSSPCDRDGTAPPASVLALASAANAAVQRASGRKSTGAGPHSHRRSQTIVAAGDLEMELLQKHKAVEELHTELESKNKALEESQEEAQLAARIGQTLLQRNQEMGAEIECKAIELQNRAESAEQVVHVLEQKLSLAITQIRSLDIARTRATLEAEQLTQELEESRSQILEVKASGTRAKEEIERITTSKMRLEEALETAQTRSSTLETTQRKLHAEITRLKDRIDVLESVERYNVEHISRLEIENQSICHQHHVLAHREMQLQLENDALTSKMVAMTTATREQHTRTQELETAIVRLHHEMEELRDALGVEQTRVVQLTHINQDLERRLDHQRRARGHSSEDEEPSQNMLRTGSLFFELSRQIREEIQDAKNQRTKHHGSTLKKESLAPEDSGSGAASALDSPSRSSTRTSRNPSSNNTDSVAEIEDPVDPTADGAATTGLPSRPPPLQLERRRSHQEDAEMLRAAVAAAKSPRQSLKHVANQNEKPSDHNSHDAADEDDLLLKEFFVLTAAAVKIAGGGLRNDACNIHNEDLFAEAMAQNVTFDQFHKWLERRLEDDLERSLSPPKAVAKQFIAISPPSPAAAPTPARRGSIISFWSR